jgi:hypothetical protein
VLELFGQRLHVLVGEETRDVRGLGRVTAHDVEDVFSLEDARHFIAGHENRNAPPRARHPFRELPLGMGVRSIDFI